MATRVTKRRPAAKKVDFYWFQGDSVRELYAQLSAAGPAAETRLEVRLSGEKMTLTVVPENDMSKVSANAPINDSRACPPICPGATTAPAAIGSRPGG